MQAKKKVEAFAASLCIPGPQCWSFSGEASGFMGSAGVDRMGACSTRTYREGRLQTASLFFCTPGFSSAGLVSFRFIELLFF